MIHKPPTLDSQSRAVLRRWFGLTRGLCRSRTARPQAQHAHNNPGHAQHRAERANDQGHPRRLRGGRRLRL